MPLPRAAAARRVAASAFASRSLRRICVCSLIASPLRSRPILPLRAAPLPTTQTSSSRRSCRLSSIGVELSEGVPQRGGAVGAARRQLVQPPRIAPMSASRSSSRSRADAACLVVRRVVAGALRRARSAPAGTACRLAGAVSEPPTAATAASRSSSSRLACSAFSRVSSAGALEVERPDEPRQGEALQHEAAHRDGERDEDQQRPLGGVSGKRLGGGERDHAAHAGPHDDGAVLPAERRRLVVVEVAQRARDALSHRGRCGAARDRCSRRGARALPRLRPRAAPSGRSTRRDLVEPRAHLLESLCAACPARVGSAARPAP